MRFAYADPPYLGLAKKFYDDPTYDHVSAHCALIERLFNEFEGWALSCHQPSRDTILTLIHLVRPDAKIREGVWVKPFCSFKPGVNPAYAWEPVFFYGGRKRGRDIPTLRDFVSANITLKKGLRGAKPSPVFEWIFEMLGARPDDEFVDIFPGTGGGSVAWEAWRAQRAA